MNLNDAKAETMRKRYSILVTIVGFCLFLTPVIVKADITEDASGICVGLALQGSSLETDATNSVFQVMEHGSGAQLSLGYRFNPVFTLEVAVGGSKHETSDSAIDASITSVQILGYYRFLPEKSLRPYLKGGIAGYGLLLESGSVSARMNGGGIVFGAGVKCFLTPKLSLGIDLTHNMIKYDEAKLSLGQFSYESSIDEHGRLTTLGLTLGWSF